MSIGTEPSILPGCAVLPPMDPPAGRPPVPAGHHGDRSKAKHPNGTPPARRKTAGRFATLNAFVDFTAGGLTRSEILVWLILFRDTKPNGLARTSQADLARRAQANVATVKRAVKGLRRRGLLAVVFRGSLRRGPSIYRVHPLARDGV